MKIHLREAQDDLSSLPVSSSMFPNPQQANFAAMTDMATQRLLYEQASLAQHQMQGLHSPTAGSYSTPVGTLEIPSPAPEPVTPNSDASILTDPFSVMVNSMQKREQDIQTREQQMPKQMQDMMSLVLSQNSNNNNHDNNSNRNYQRPPGHVGRIYTPAGRNPNNRSSGVRKYCWTHGVCAHTGTDCNTPATGNQEQATFTNMMNGSTTRCYWLPPT